MNRDDFTARLRAFELYSQARVMPDCWIVVRVDGKNFSALTSKHFEKPFDDSFHALMTSVSETLVTHMQGLFAYTQSDEISLVLPPDWSLFDRRAEKLTSLCAAIASAHFSVAFGQPVCFDSRVWVGPTQRHVVDYMRWRQSDASRCALNNLCYWSLRQDNKSAREATRILEGMTSQAKHELLHTYTLNFNDLPTWQKRGVLIAWEHYTKQGLNPITGQTTQAQRRRLTIERDIPMKDEFETHINDLLEANLEHSWMHRQRNNAPNENEP